MIGFLILAAAAAAAEPTVFGQFDCTADVPVVIAGQGDKMQLQRMGGIDAGKMAFTLVLKGDKAQANWPDSPLNIGGKAKVMATGTDAGMALFTSIGPCVFTEKGCATMVNYAKQADGSLKLLLSPTALISDQAKTTRQPFLVIVPGTCTAKKDEG